MYLAGPARHSLGMQTDTRDTADEIAATAEDPTPAEITDPQHPDFLEPYPHATAIGE